MPSVHKAKKKTRRERSPSVSSNESEDERILFFIPTQGIHIEVLAFYLTRYLGDDSEAEPGQNPQNPRQVGFLIKSRFGLTAAMVRDLRNDSESWNRERQEKRVREPYRLSDTAEDRRNHGPSGQPTVPPKTAAALEAAARQAGRAGSVQPQTQSTVQSGYQQGAARHNVENTPAYGWNSQRPADTTTSRHQPSQFQSQQYNFQSTATGQPRQGSVSGYGQGVNVSNYAHNQQTTRFSSPTGESGVVMPSIESRHQLPTPAIEEEDDVKPGRPKPAQPSNTSSQGFPSLYSTAGPGRERHNR